jgi:hypothetical protein
MKSEDVKKRQRTEGVREILRRIAGRQAVGDDSRIDFDDIPRLRDARARERR